MGGWVWVVKVGGRVEMGRVFGCWRSQGRKDSRRSNVGPVRHCVHTF